MAPLKSSSAKITLPYPLYACDFDPANSTKLVVGGGGGASRTGVGNKITVLDASNPEKLVEVADIELSKEEDNPTSLATGLNHLVYAGVNASPKDIKNGENSHFRIYDINLEHEENDRPNIREETKLRLFSRVEKDSYQRITRLAKPLVSKSQLGAITTGLAKRSEIALFETQPHGAPKKRGSLPCKAEAVDVDIIQVEEESHLLAYCEDHDIFVTEITSKTDISGSECIPITPLSNGGKPKTATLRALRWLTKDHLITLSNLYRNTGVVLEIVKVTPSKFRPARTVQSIRLPKYFSKATGLCIVDLNNATNCLDTQNETQFVIAVAGHNRSISLFTIDFKLEAEVFKPSDIKPLFTFVDVHPLQITGIAFSNVAPCPDTVTVGSTSQVLRLCSVGISNTVVVHTLPIISAPCEDSHNRGLNPRYYIVKPRGTGVLRRAALSISVILAVIIAIIIQALLEIRGEVPLYLGAREHVPVQWQEAIIRNIPQVSMTMLRPTFTITRTVIPISAETSINVDSTSSVLLEDLMKKFVAGENHGLDGIVVLSGEGEQIKAILHRQDGGAEQTKDSEEIPTGSTWEDLNEAQKLVWIQRLKEFGEWPEDFPAIVFKGVLFGEVMAAGAEDDS
ncbi:Bgt-5142 [Blumeria graminis f. sp. tritici]|uniref:Guanine nucleotide-exchange factor SEC12 n=2 Tax=Blumeria graminis f. sp. tritici TaxID=62690 RepID=A0A061HGA4_BLUGR|nr:hypothetical protein BGT96224_5142 [Blumeria graminis f. sp. tritici 96224]VCU38833.1 Bgt-5142 [Blumeria graminis f. sp. tritici]